MNKKLFSWKALAGVALLAAFSMTSCTSDDPIDPTNPSGVKPTNTGSIVGGAYDWEVTPAKYTDFDPATAEGLWAKAANEVMKYLKDNKKNTINVLVNVEGFKLTNETFVLPDFWKNDGTGANGKVVNITFKGNYKNADFERAHAIDKADVVADMSKFPVKIDVNTLKGAEINFTFNTCDFDLYLDTREARTTLSGESTIGYMFANANTNSKDALELKSGTIEGLDMRSTGKFKGAYAGVWAKNNEWLKVNASGIILANGTDVVPGAKNVYVEATAGINTYYRPNATSWAQYQLGTVKFVQKASNSVWFWLDGSKDGGATYIGGDTVENIIGFNKSKCFVGTNSAAKALVNIGSMVKVTVRGTAVLKKDIFTDVAFDNYAEFSTEDITSFADVTFNNLGIIVHADNQTLSFSGVNFKSPVTLASGIFEGVVTKSGARYYQWIVDVTSGAGHFEEFGGATNKALLDANKDKAIKEYNSADIDYDATTQIFYKPVGSQASNDQLKEANSSYVVVVYDFSYDGTQYIPEGTKVMLDNCKFAEPTNGEMTTNNTALNNVWGNKKLWDEQCWYDVFVDGTKYNWKKATDGGYSTVKYVLVKPAAAE